MLKKISHNGHFFFGQHASIVATIFFAISVLYAWLPQYALTFQPPSSCVWCCPLVEIWLSLCCNPSRFRDYIGPYSTFCLYLPCTASVPEWVSDTDTYKIENLSPRYWRARLRQTDTDSDDTGDDITNVRKTIDHKRLLSAQCVKRIAQATCRLCQAFESPARCFTSKAGSMSQHCTIWIEPSHCILKILWKGHHSTFAEIYQICGVGDIRCVWHG